MTIEEILQCDAAKLEAMSNDELLKHFEPMLNITRPERQTATVKKEQQFLQANPKLQAGVNLLKTLGIDVGNSLQPYRKKK